MKDKNLFEVLQIYLKEKKIDSLINNKFLDVWHVASGVKLAAVTELKKVDEKNKTLIIKPNSTSTSALLKLEKNRILEDWNRLLPEHTMEKIKVLKSYS